MTKASMKVLSRLLAFLAVMAAGVGGVDRTASAQPVGRVTKLAVTVSHQTVSFTWTNGSGNEGANVYVDGTKVFSWGWPYDAVHFRQLTDTGVPLGKHTVRVVDYNTEGEGLYSAPVTFDVTQRSHRSALKAPPAGAGEVGFYVDGDTPAKVRSVASIVGVTPQIISTYTDGSSWSAISHPNVRHPDPRLRYMLSTNLCVSTSPGDNLAAMPHHLAVYTRLARRIYAAGYRKSIYRLGWESSGNFGGGGFCWTQSGSTLYKNDFRLAATAIRKGDPTATFDWNIGYGADGEHFQNGQTFQAWYPGGKYVNYITTDTYGGAHDDYTIDHTLELGYDVAAYYHKPWGISEWGQSGGDNAEFMTDMEDMIDGIPVVNPPTGKTVQTVIPAYQVYFWGDGSQLTNFANSEKLYEQYRCRMVELCAGHQAS
jgi:hypothetical protein